jgi:predicted DNA-binding transcriptional regulator YafY
MARRSRKERGRQLARILRLVRKLEHSRAGFTMDDLVKQLKVSRRTLYRDMHSLEEAGFRLESDGGLGETKRWRFTRGQQRSLSSTFTENELLSLYFCLNLLGPLKGTPLRAGVESLLDKIESTFSGKDRDRYTEVIFTHLARPRMSRDFRKHAATLSAVSRGCVDQKKIEVSYRASSEERAKTYVFHPYCIAYFDGEIYTVGHSELRDAIRTLRVDRIQRVTEMNERFKRPKDFDAEEYIVRGFSMYAEGEATDVRLEFNKVAARTVKEKEFHPSQTVREKSGGKVQLNMRVQGLSEVARWVMYHAPNARVLEPKKLSRLVGDWAREVAGKHR